MGKVLEMKEIDLFLMMTLSLKTCISQGQTENKFSFQSCVRFRKAALIFQELGQEVGHDLMVQSWSSYILKPILGSYESIIPSVCRKPEKLCVVDHGIVEHGVVARPLKLEDLGVAPITIFHR